MTVFVISQHTTSWSISCLSETAMTTSHGIPTEVEAPAKAFREARNHKPSQVVRISNRGDAKVIAEFASEEPISGTNKNK